MDTHLTKEHARKLLEVLQGHPLEAIMTLALLTCMRRDELLHLKWRDLNLERRELCVHATKTGDSQRTFHLSEGVTQMLTRHYQQQMEARLKVGAAWQDLDLVFPDPVGKLLKPISLFQGWHDLLEQAHLPSLPFHELRVARWRALLAQVNADEGEPDDLRARFLDLEKDPYPF